MTIYTLVLYTAIAAGIVSGITSLIRKPDSWLIDYVKNFVGCLFIFSGFVKAIDPMGTGFKMEQYLAEFNLMAIAPLSLFGSVFMIVLEIALGVALLLGVFRKWTVWTMVPLIVFFTFLTGYTSVTGNVTDCGCFGDFLKLKPIVSFSKDIVLSVLTALLVFNWKNITPLFSKEGKLPIGIVALATIGSLWFCFSNFYSGLPWKDFRPFKNGTNLPAAKVGEEADVQIATTYYTLINSNTKEEKEVTTKEYTANKEYWAQGTPWKIDKDRSRKVIHHEGSDSKLLEFEYANKDGIDMMEETMSNPDYSFMVVSYNREKSNKEGFKKINKIISNAEAEGKSTFCITKLEGKENEVEQFRHDIQAGYPFYTADDIMLKTIIRSNPGLILLKNGTIIKKFHHRELSDYATIKKKYMK